MRNCPPIGRSLAKFLDSMKLADNIYFATRKTFDPIGFGHGTIKF
jgi:hypothetical protein